MQTTTVFLFLLSFFLSGLSLYYMIKLNLQNKDNEQQIEELSRLILRQQKELNHLKEASNRVISIITNEAIRK